MDNLSYKTCTGCSVELSFSAFNQNRLAKDGFTWKCKTCLSVLRAAAYERIKADPEKYAKTLLDLKESRKENMERGRMYAQKRRDTYSADCKNQSAKWRGKNPEVFKALMAKWKKANKSLVASYAATRRASKLSATPSWAGSEFEQFVIAECYSLSTLRSKVTGIRHHVDHVVPLQSKTVCGLHCAANLAIIPASVNYSKNNRHWPEMPV